MVLSFYWIRFPLFLIKKKNNIKIVIRYYLPYGGSISYFIVLGKLHNTSVDYYECIIAIYIYRKQSITSSKNDSNFRIR